MTTTTRKKAPALVGLVAGLSLALTALDGGSVAVLAFGVDADLSVSGKWKQQAGD